MRLVLKKFEELLNGSNKPGEMDKFIAKRLKSKAEDLRDIGKEA